MLLTYNRTAQHETRCQVAGQGTNSKTSIGTDHCCGPMLNANGLTFDSGADRRQLLVQCSMRSQ